MSSVQPPPGPTGPLGAVVSLNTAWYNLMSRIGIAGPKAIQQAAMHLDQVDRVTGINTRRKPS